MTLELLNDKNSIIKKVLTNNTFILEDLDSVYLIADYEKFDLDVEFDDNLLEIILLKIKSARRVFSGEFDFIDITSLIAERYLLIYISLIANINIKRY